MSKVNSRERIVVGVDAVKKYAQIAKEHHDQDCSIYVSKGIWFHHVNRAAETEIIVYCSICGTHCKDLSLFLKAHGIED